MGVVTLFVSTGRTATLGPPVASESLEAGGPGTATAGRIAAAAAIELPRNDRLFIGDFHFDSPGCSFGIRPGGALPRIHPAKAATRSRMILELYPIQPGNCLSVRLRSCRRWGLSAGASAINGSLR